MKINEFIKYIQVQDSKGKYVKFKPNKIQQKLIDVIDYADEHNLHIIFEKGRKSELNNIETVLKLMEYEYRGNNQRN